MIFGKRMGCPSGEVSVRLSAHSRKIIHRAQEPDTISVVIAQGLGYASLLRLQIHVLTVPTHRPS